MEEANFELKANGVLSSWRSSCTQRLALLTKMQAMGMADYVPAQTTKHLACRNTLKAMFGADKVKVLPGHGSFAVIRAKCTADSWSGESVLVVTTTPIGLEFSGETELEEEIRARFAREQGYIPAEEVSSMLVSIAGKLGGIPCLSGGGGLYWIPEDSVSIWKELAKCVEGSSVTGRSRIAVFTTVMDDETIKGVILSLEDNISKELQHIEKEVNTKGLKKNALNNRLKKSDDLRAKIRSFEKIFGTTLTTMHDAVEKTKKHSVVAALQAL
tara:strand:- start:214 stop:1026 length:813 start_codon:yes stop_codon:yes gene_type:complete